MRFVSQFFSDWILLHSLLASSVAEKADNRLKLRQIFHRNCQILQSIRIHGPSHNSFLLLRIRTFKFRQILFRCTFWREENNKLLDQSAHIIC